MRTHSHGSAAHIKKQVRIVGIVSQCGLQVNHRLGRLVVLQLCYTQRRRITSNLEMGNRLGGIALRQQRVTQQLVNGNGVGAQFGGVLQGCNCLGSVMFLHIGVAQAEKNF